MTTRPRPEVLAAFAKSENIDVPHGCLECVNARTALRRANEAWHHASESERIAEASLRQLASERLAIAVALSDGVIQRYTRGRSADWQDGFDCGFDSRGDGSTMLGVLFLMMGAFVSGGLLGAGIVAVWS